jgi:hypothetical protein
MRARAAPPGTEGGVTGPHNKEQESRVVPVTWITGADGVSTAQISVAGERRSLSPITETEEIEMR